MTLLITGSSGFIGTHLCRRLDSVQPYRVVRRARTSSAAAENAVDIEWPEGLAGLSFENYCAVIHLALPPLPERCPYEEARRDCVRPLELIASRIAETNPACRLVFVTSQSAKAQTGSLYGKVKWECEQLLRQTDIDWVGLRPGLVIGPGSKGLFQRILAFINHSPVVPIIGNGTALVQPVDVGTVVDAIIAVIDNPAATRGRIIPIAHEPLPFEKLLRMAAEAAGRHRLFVHVPVPLIVAALKVMERLLRNPPLTVTNLRGLIELEPMETQTMREVLRLSPPPLNEILRAACS